MTSIGERGTSPNPVQRFLVERPVFVPLVRFARFVPAVVVFGPAVASPDRLLVVSAAFLVVLYLWWLVSPGRRTSRDERWHEEAVLWGWRKSWPGYADSELLAERQSVRESHETADLE